MDQQELKQQILHHDSAAEREQLAELIRKYPNGEKVNVKEYVTVSGNDLLLCKISRAYVKIGGLQVYYVCLPLKKNGERASNRNPVFIPEDRVFPLEQA